MFKYTDKQCDSTIHCKAIITGCYQTVRLARSKYFVHLFTHGVLYIKGTLVNLNHK